MNQIPSPDRKRIVLREWMDKSKILICELSEGTVGHEASTLLGSLLLSSLQIAAMSRADLAESERTDCVVVIDEFYSYSAGVLGHCGTISCMTIGSRDADILADLSGFNVKQDELMRIPRYLAYVKTTGKRSSQYVFDEHTVS